MTTESALPFDHSQPVEKQPDELAAMPFASNPEEIERDTFRSRMGNRLDSIKYRTADTLSVAKAEYTESEHRSVVLAAGLGTVAVQAADRARVSIMFVPALAVEVLKETGSPAKAGAAAGLAFAGWCATVGAFTTEGLNQFPETMDSFKGNFPKIVEAFDDSLAGVGDYDNNKPPDTRSLPRRIGSRMWTGVRRSLNVVSIGTAAYVSTSAAKGNSRGSTHRLNATASAEGGAAAGGVVWGISEYISNIDDPVLAGNVIDVASDMRLWYGLAGVSIAGTYIANKFSKKGNPDSQLEKDNSVEPDPVTDSGN